jgi:hypothetical protein
MNRTLLKRSLGSAAVLLSVAALGGAGVALGASLDTTPTDTPPTTESVASRRRSTESTADSTAASTEGTTTDSPTTESVPTSTDTTGTDTTNQTATEPTGTTNSNTTQNTADPGPQDTSQQTSLPATTSTTPTQTTPCQTPTNAGLSCGNNAATQIAVVTQNCNSVSNAAGALQIHITDTEGGELADKVVANSVCLNYSQIYQIVHQFCINCQLVVQNFYSTTNNTNNSSATYVQGWTGPIYLGYCMPKDRPVMRGDGTVGWLVVLLRGQPDTDPVYKGATPAVYDVKNGYVCQGTGSAPIPAAFTLTVPASLIGQFVNLCLQPSDPKAKPVCHSVKIDGSASVTLPVAANVAVSVTKKPLAINKPLKPLTKKQLSALAKRYNKLAHPPKRKQTAAPTKKAVKR